MKLTIDKIIKYILLLVLITLCIYTILYTIYIKYSNNIKLDNNTNNNINYNTNNNINYKLEIPNKNKPDLLVYYCGKFKLNDPIKEAIYNLNMKITTNIEETQIYLPCGYNRIEVELNKLRFINELNLNNTTNTDLINNNNKFENKVILGISGCDKLCSKNEIWFNLKTEYGIDNASNIMPLTFLVNDERDMIMLKNIENDTNFTTHINKNIYILKNNNQGKKGLYMTDNISRLINYNKTKLKEYKVIQKYITNPYLINKRKLNIRLYVLIYNIRDNETQWYLYNNGKCIYNNKDYEPEISLLEHNLQDKEQHFTSLNLDTNYIYNILDNPETLAELKVHFGNENYNYVMYKILNKLRKIKLVYNKNNILQNKDNLQNNTTIQYFGIDVILNDNLEPYILEFNKGPEMIYKSPNDKQLKTELINTVFEISKNLYKQHYRSVNNILSKCFTKC